MKNMTEKDINSSVEFFKTRANEDILTLNLRRLMIYRMELKQMNPTQ